MTRVSNNAAGGTASAAVTASNSGGASGDAFDDVTIGGAGAINFTAGGSLFGPMGYAINPDMSQQAYLGYSTSLGTQSEIYGRMYVNLPYFPFVTLTLVMLGDSGSGLPCASITVAGAAIKIRDRSSTVLGDTGPIFSTNSTFRLEWHVIGGSGTSGTVEAKVFLDPNSTTSDATLTATAVNTRGAFNQYQVGQTETIAVDFGLFYLDEIVWDTAGYPGRASVDVSPGFINQSAATLTGPKANLNLSSVGFINQAPTLSAPNVRRGINVTSLINQSAATLTGPTVGRLIQGVGAFQLDAFQTNTFQANLELFIDRSAATFTPSVSQGANLVLVPGPSLASATGFQSNTFQDDTFQEPGTGIAELATAIAPIISTANSGAFPPIINNAAATFAPHLSTTGRQIVSFDGVGEWDSSIETWDSTTTLWDGSGGLVSQSPTMFAPNLLRLIQPALIDNSAVVFNATVGALSFNVGLINNSAVTLPGPAIKLSVTVGLIDNSANTVDDQLLFFTQEVDPGLINNAASTFDPQLNPQEVDTPLIDNSAQMSPRPDISQSILVGLLDNSAATFTPTSVGPVILPGLIDNSAVVFIASLERLFPGFIDNSAVTFTPRIVPFVVQTVRLDEAADGLIDVSADTFDLTIAVAQPQSVFLVLIDRTAQPSTPRIIVATRSVIELRGRYEPVIRLRGRYDPTIRNRAMVSQQG